MLGQYCEHLPVSSIANYHLKKILNQNSIQYLTKRYIFGEVFLQVINPSSGNSQGREIRYNTIKIQFLNKLWYTASRFAFQ